MKMRRRRLCWHFVEWYWEGYDFMGVWKVRLSRAWRNGRKGYGA